MWIFRYIGFLLAAALLTGCESLPRTEYVRDFDFRQYRTFMWVPHDEHEIQDPILDSDITHARIKKAATTSLLGMGFSADHASPDFLVTFHTPTKQRFRSVGYSAGLGYPYYDRFWRHYIHYATPEVESFEQAAIVIDIIDRRGDRLLWRGWDMTRLTQDNFSEDRISERVGRILSVFPP